MLTFAKQHTFLTATGIALFAAAVLFSFTSTAHAQTYTLEENGSYYTQSGSVFSDSSCGQRSACKWNYNEQYSESTWLTWDYHDAHDYYNEHFHYTQGSPYVFIPTRGTTENAVYERQVWEYDPPGTPSLNTNWNWYGYFDQSAYLNSWVSLGTYADETEIYKLRLDDMTGENQSWYTVVWDATKTVY